MLSNLTWIHLYSLHMGMQYMGMQYAGTLMTCTRCSPKPMLRRQGQRLHMDTQKFAWVYVLCRTQLEVSSGKGRTRVLTSQLYIELYSSSQ
jgi:hypothetical protein